MKAFYLLFTIAIFWETEAFPQEDFPQAYEINADTSTYLLLPYAKWQYSIDHGKKLTIDDVVKPQYSSRFTNLDTLKGKISYFGKLWVRYKIKNNLPNPLGITMPEYAFKADVYISESQGDRKHYVTGYDVPWNKRDGFKRIMEIPYTIRPKSEITIYEMYQDFDPGSFTTKYIGIKSKVIAENYQEYDNSYTPEISLSIMTGFLLFAAIFNFFFYYIVREKVYLIYSTLLFLGALFSPPLFDLFLRVIPAPGSAIPISRLILGYLIVVIILKFLQASENHPVWHKWMQRSYGLFAVLLSMMTIHFFLDKNKESIQFKIVSGLAICLIAFVVIGFIVIIVSDLIKKKRSSQLFILAVAPFILSLICLVVLNLFQFFNIEVIRKYMFVSSIIWAVTVISWSLFDRFRILQNAHTQQALEKERLIREKEEERSQLIAQQNEQLEQQVRDRTAELSRSLTELKQTQSQLIQSEKLASLGELTAGIAHEIQNPLNFVNNFSEVSMELADEMQTELASGNTKEVKAIADDIKQNLEKIHHHGKRADGIVKNMLQHSRNNSGERQPTDLNTLADEYLRLSYHGLRAKDKSFNAMLTTHFEPNLPKANLIAQDIGRVLLNIFNNAFYSVNQKRKKSPPDYAPEVIVSTAASNGQIIISIKDNGTGIPGNIKEKILQPFFTTKPTGEGTGLGLSLSYDTVVKGHGGTLQVNSQEGEYAEFIIALPL